MTFIFFSLIAAMLGFLRPVWGFAIFLLGQTGGVGLFEELGILGTKLGPSRPDNMALIGAITALWLTKKNNVNSLKGKNAIGILLWFFTIMIFISRIAEVGIEDTWIIIKSAFYCLLYAPLFVAIGKLSEKERSSLRNTIIIVSVFTATLCVLTVVTGSYYLYDMLTRREDYDLPSDFISARLTIAGVWYVVPLGFWLSLRELLLSRNLLRFKSLLYFSAASIMVISFLLNMSRGTILALITGLFAMVTLSTLLSSKVKKIRILIITFVLFISALYAGFKFEGLYYYLGQRFSEGIESPSIIARQEKNELMMESLFSELPVLGHKDDLRNRIIRGDPHTFIQIWWDYGLLAALSFVAIITISFWSMIKTLKSHWNLSEETLKTAIILMAFYLGLQLALISGYYLHLDAVFVLTFFFSEVVHVSRQPLLKTNFATYSNMPNPKINVNPVQSIRNR
jgi:hypothetical protein